MPSSKEEDRALAKAARTVMIKSSLDIGEVMVSASDGYIELTGKVRPPRNFPGTFSMKKEIEDLKQHIRGVRGVKEVYATRLTIVDN